jgi:hypothetical protein
VRPRSLVGRAFLALLSLGLILPPAQATPTTLSASLRGTLDWSILPTPPVDSGQLWAVATIDDTDAWAGGHTLGTEEMFQFHWDGSSWSHVEDREHQHGHMKSMVAVDSDDVWAVGYEPSEDCYRAFTVTRHWNGRKWSRVRSPNPSKDPCFGANYLTGVAGLAPNDLWAVGYQTGEPGYSPLRLHWDGTTWRALGEHVPFAYQYLHGLAVVAADDVWAAGWSWTSRRGTQGYAEHFDGARWKRVRLPVLEDEYSLSAVSAIDSDDVWAVGYRGAGAQPVALHWDGAAWAVVAMPTLPDGSNILTGVTALSSDDVWAVGYDYEVPSGNIRTLVMHWDGTAWSRVDSPNAPDASSVLHGVAPDGTGGLWAVGYQYPHDLSQPIAPLILRGVPSG